MKNKKSQKTENFRFWVPTGKCELNPDNFMIQYSSWDLGYRLPSTGQISVPIQYPWGRNMSRWSLFILNSGPPASPWYLRKLDSCFFRRARKGPVYFVDCLDHMILFACAPTYHQNAYGQWWWFKNRGLYDFLHLSLSFARSSHRFHLIWISALGPWWNPIRRFRCMMHDATD